MTAPFGRVLTAMVTPFTADGSVDYPTAAALAEHLVEQGNDGLVVNGTTGESPTTSDDEKLRLIQAVREAVGDRTTILAGVGTNDTHHSVELARQAAQAGAHGALVVTPYYNKPPQDALISHFTTIADATELPVMLYDIPGRSGVALSHDTLVRLAHHPRIVANKDAKGDVFAAQRVLAETDLCYYSGDDALNLPLISIGAVGVVSVIGHIVADRLAAMIEAYETGDVATAREINTALTSVVVGIMSRTQGVVMVKAALDILGRPGGGTLRAPMLAASQAEREQLRIDLKAAGFEL